MAAHRVRRLQALAERHLSLKPLAINQMHDLSNLPEKPVIDPDPMPTTKEGGAWWDVAVPETSPRAAVNEAHAGYLKARAAQAMG